MTFLKKIPYSFLIPAAILLGLAPFFPAPHLVEKLRMLINGQLFGLIDVFDLLWHALPIILLILKARFARCK